MTENFPTTARTPRIEIAQVQDARTLAEFARRTFLDAFAKDNDPDDINRYVDKAFSQTALRGELEHPASVFLLARDGNELMGYMKLRTGPAPDCVTGNCPMEIHRLYVDKKRAPAGLGSKLMEAGLKLTQEANCDVAWLGAWSQNSAAERFYQRWNFQRVGKHDFMMGKERQTDWLMQLAIPASPI